MHIKKNLNIYKEQKLFHYCRLFRLEVVYIITISIFDMLR